MYEHAYTMDGASLLSPEYTLYTKIFWGDLSPAIASFHPVYIYIIIYMHLQQDKCITSYDFHYVFVISLMTWRHFISKLEYNFHTKLGLPKGISITRTSNKKTMA